MTGVMKKGMSSYFPLSLSTLSHSFPAGAFQKTSRVLDAFIPIS